MKANANSIGCWTSSNGWWLLRNFNVLVTKQKTKGKSIVINNTFIFYNRYIFIQNPKGFFVMEIREIENIEPKEIFG